MQQKKILLRNLLLPFTFKFLISLYVLFLAIAFMITAFISTIFKIYFIIIALTLFVVLFYIIYKILILENKLSSVSMITLKPGLLELIWANGWRRTGKKNIILSEIKSVNFNVSISKKETYYNKFVCCYKTALNMNIILKNDKKIKSYMHYESANINISYGYFLDLYDLFKNICPVTYNLKGNDTEGINIVQNYIINKTMDITTKKLLEKKNTFLKSIAEKLIFSIIVILFIFVIVSFVCQMLKFFNS